MNYLKTIKAVKASQNEGLTTKEAANTCKLIKELAMYLYNWDVIKRTYAQAEAIMTLADNMFDIYRRGY